MLRALERQRHQEELSQKHKEVLEQRFVPTKKDIGQIWPRPEVTSSNPPKRPPPPIKPDFENQAKDWEEIQRRQCDLDEQLMRQMEADEQLRRQSEVEAERAKMAESLEQQMMEEESRRLEELQTRSGHSKKPQESSNIPNGWKKPVMSQKSVEEEMRKLQEWEELKRQEIENEERALRKMERERERQLQSQEAEERLKFQNSIEDQIMEEEAARVRALSTSSTGSQNEPKRAAMKCQISIEEEKKLKDWEELKRRESEDEEQMLRQMEREALEQKSRAEELERQKFQEAIERQCRAEESKMLAESQTTKSSVQTSFPKKKVGKGVDTQTEWERIRRQQEEAEEQMRLLTERELEKQRLAQEVQRRMHAVSEMRKLKKKRSAIEANKIIEEDNEEGEEDEEWERFKRKQEEEEELARLEEERERQKKHPSVRQQQSEEMLIDVKRHREVKMPISEEQEEDEEQASEINKLNEAKLAEATRVKELQERRTKLDNQIKMERAKLADLERMEADANSQLKETATAVKKVAQSLHDSAFTDGKSQLRADSARQTRCPVSSGSDDCGTAGYSEGCDDLSVGIDLPISQDASTSDERKTPIPTTGELDDLARQNILTPPRSPLRADLETKLEIDEEQAKSMEPVVSNKSGLGSEVLLGSDKENKTNTSFQV